jgi:hypothetical protein
MSKYSSSIVDQTEEEFSDFDDHSNASNTAQDSLLNLINANSIAPMGNEDLVLITQRPITLDAKSCVIQVFTSKVL